MAVIRTLLVANRAEIAVRVMRTARAMGIRTVAVYAEPDRDAVHVRAANRSVALRGSTASDSYLDIDQVIDAARRSGADAVHPGYGFLSENAGFAEACAAEGLIFVGPSPEAIGEMGLKHRAKELARTAGVPVLPDALLTTDDPADWAAAAKTVGYPLLVKATAGGGGRGMRLVETAVDLGDAVAGARREAAGSFGDGRVFLERYLPAPRHVEVQVFGDSHGRVVHLCERECSVQRRHQKVIEEAPSPAVTPALRTRMGATAVALARTLCYVGAGTVEFLLDGEGDEAPFYFLEMNTRLQVEHPVTEAVTGLDLVRLQLLVAMDDPLPLPEADITPDGHAIEVRLYAEDPAAGFSPTFGPIWRYAPGSLPVDGIRYDDGVATGSEVSTYYDPMLAKVIAHAPTRTEAAGRLATGLAGMHLHGPGTNREFLVAALRDPDFLAGATRTDFINRHPALLTGGVDAGTEQAHLAAAMVTTAERRRSTGPAGGLASAGWRLFPGPGQKARWQPAGDEPFDVEYHLGPASLRWKTAAGAHEVKLVSIAGDTLHLAVDGVGRTCTVHHTPDGTVWVNDPERQTAWQELPRFIIATATAAGGGSVSDVPGTVVAVLVAPGQEVKAGDPLVIVEAMKMEHRITATSDGVVEAVRVAVGDRVDAHQVLVVVADREGLQTG